MRLSTGPLSSAIFRVARAHKALAAKLLRSTGLRPGQELVLMTLWEHGPQRMTDLVQTLDTDAPSMTRSIGRLERAGLVRRGPSPVDRRVSVVEATEASVRLRADVEAAWAELEAVTAGSLGKDERRQLLALLTGLETPLREAGDRL
ncbi:MarR family transcriptional regulator [Microbacterium sp. dk485]|uniref:MarR family transcriptional regulator n=2 Tax=Microbacteriaceae TaxID=85023 RepID=A0ABX5SZT7_9MICO|nr:MarR family transcriptional regulator [Microbacterium wangchenii]TFV85573.1 MarR family transcriptional regulator [Microbacterium sp. dk485]TXK11922.1 winged helix-turn-helix transcriptional regulator [Microbacterium wangchenii]